MDEINKSKLGDLTVLLVEDDFISAKLASIYLNDIGVNKIVVANNGLEAVQRYNSSIDMVFMDINMPGMDGANATREILKKDKDARIVYLTAHAKNSLPSHCYKSGALDAFNKPLNTDYLINGLNNYSKKFKKEDDLLLHRRI